VAGELRMPSFAPAASRSVLAVLLVASLTACTREDAAPSAPEAPTASPPPREPAAPPPREKLAPPRPAQLQQVTIKALGMYCEESCPLKVRYALADITSIYELGFDLSNESIFVSYDASLGTPKEVTKPMLAAIKTTGFDPWLAKESWPADATVQVVRR